METNERRSQKSSNIIDALLIIFVLLTLVFLMSSHANAMTVTKTPPTIMLQWRAPLTREAQAIYGIKAPVAMFAGQIQQESGGRADVTAWDNGRGLGQFMDGTAKQVSRQYPELGAPNPYNPEWAIRALVRLNLSNYKAVKGKNDCERWAGALKGYNAGAGYVQRAQRASPDPLTWYTLTEYINTGQGDKNFLYSQKYPRWIMFYRQPGYVGWGGVVCDIHNQPIDKL